MSDQPAGHSIYSDSQLRSCLGRYDGHVYPALLQWVKQSDLNQSHVTDAHRKHIAPLMREMQAKL